MFKPGKLDDLAGELTWGDCELLGHRNQATPMLLTGEFKLLLSIVSEATNYLATALPSLPPPFESPRPTDLEKKQKSYY